jgi:hypothetical protein
MSTSLDKTPVLSCSRFVCGIKGSTNLALLTVDTNLKAIVAGATTAVARLGAIVTRDNLPVKLSSISNKFPVFK